MADHSDFCAASGVPGGSLDFDNSVVNLGHFLCEQFFHEVGMSPRQENLRAASFAPDRKDQRANAVADTNHFARDLLIAPDHAFGAAEIDHDVPEFDSLDDAGDDFADAILEFFKLAFALGVPNFLEDHLLCSLGRDPSEFDRGQRVDDEITDLGVLLKLRSALEIDLLEMIFGLVDDFENAPQAKVAASGIELCADVIFCTVTRTGGALNRILHCFDDDALVDQLLARNGVGNREQFCLVGADGSGCCGHVFIPLQSQLCRRLRC